MALIALLACGLAIATTRTGQTFRPDDLKDGIDSFDSFSEPALACAILSQEAERLLSVYREHEDEEYASQAERAGVGMKAGARPRTGQLSGPLTPAGKRSGPKASAIQSLNALDTQVHGLELSLGRKLLVVYAHQQLWDKYVDRYLQMIREQPGRDEILVHVRFALDAAFKCGRAEEVADVLQHVVRFHPELKTAAGLKSVLAEWKAEGSPDLEVSRQ